ncbi:hypothetical protein [Polaromonas naphthalenivorans]|nr:hypothetical protein [Polaromonas naphthalenivorans]
MKNTYFIRRHISAYFSVPVPVPEIQTISCNAHHATLKMIGITAQGHAA